MRRLALAAALAVFLLAVPVSAQTVTPDPAQQAAEAARQAAEGATGPLTIRGDGRGNSEPFLLAGGAYTVVWSAADTTMLSFIELRSASDPSDGRAVELLDMGDGPAVRSGQAGLYSVTPGAYYLHVSVTGGWTVTFTPLAAAAASAPLTLADFVGRWENHNYLLRIGPDGTADMVWRRGGGGVESGNATLTIERVEGRTLYGTILATNYPDGPARGPFQLTEYDYGVGYLMDGVSVGMVVPGAPYDPHYGRTLCGPRFATAPEWFRGTAPCGA